MIVCLADEVIRHLRRDDGFLHRRNRTVYRNRYRFIFCQEKKRVVFKKQVINETADDGKLGKPGPEKPLGKRFID